MGTNMSSQKKKNRNSSMAINAAPIVIAVSATLNTGQWGSARKSTT